MIVEEFSSETSRSRVWTDFSRSEEAVWWTAADMVQCVGIDQGAM